MELEPISCLEITVKLQQTNIHLWEESRSSQHHADCLSMRWLAGQSLYSTPRPRALAEDRPPPPYPAEQGSWKTAVATEPPSLGPPPGLPSKASVLVQPLLLMSSAAPGERQMEAVYGFTR